MKAYKIFKKRKDGTLGSLFINSRAKLPVGEWMKAKGYRKKGFAYRPGWHCTFTPLAPHLEVGGDGVGKNRIWAEVEVKDFTTFDRPEHQGGAWVLSNNLKIVQEISLEEVNRILREKI